MKRILKFILIFFKNKTLELWSVVSFIFDESEYHLVDSYKWYSKILNSRLSVFLFIILWIVVIAAIVISVLFTIGAIYYFFFWLFADYNIYQYASVLGDKSEIYSQSYIYVVVSSFMGSALLYTIALGVIVVAFIAITYIQYLTYKFLLDNVKKAWKESADK